ncbi:DNA topoisomerase 2 [uncultured virus]|nr:DNA topoisomerase 2 [uncultured virus]
MNKPNNISNKNVKTIEEEFQKMNQHEHILEIPDTYIGGIDEDQAKMWIYRVDKKLEFKNINYIPGLYKIFDEIVVNARDQTVRDPTCDKIKITIDKEKGEISCWNNGMNGVPVEIHKTYKKYVPELIFGDLLTSGNYRQKGKTVGGKNGYGAKLTNIFSTNFYVEVNDSKRKLIYSQNFSENMYKKTDPKIAKSKNKESYILFRFTPDYPRFGINGLTEDIVNLFTKRVYDIAACTPSNVNVYLNEQLLGTNHFLDYIKLFFESELPNLVFDDSNPRWKIGIIFDAQTGYRHISYVNGICTFQGGSHVNHVLDQILGKLNEHITSKHKNLKIKNSQIRDNLTIFIDCVIEDPCFSSQTKELLTNKVNTFGSRWEITDKIVKELIKTGIVTEVVKFAKLRAMADMEKFGGKKKSNLKGIEKLDDADWAGSRKSKYCRLILTEGDSAKAFAVAGIELIGREKFGIFPLRGKLLNVREAGPNKLLKNEEIKNIMQIIGLKPNKKYKDVNKLRYGGIVILTDQDSVTGDTPLLLKQKDEINIKRIDDIATNWLKLGNGKEYSATDFNIWTDDGWTNIKKIIRHKVNKKIYRILTNTGIVDVTEDHSLLDKNKNKISPQNCKIGEELLHSFPKFNDHKINLPQKLENCSVQELWNYASKLKIQYYQTKKKEKLIKILQNIHEKESLILNKQSNIPIDEAHVMGFFFADGKCGIYKWKYTLKKKNRTNYIWNLGNTNKDYLEKCKKFLEKNYDLEFKIIEYDVSKKPFFKLIINGGIKAKEIIEKYRNMFYDKHKQKFIPSEILNASIQIRQSFFNGYYDADGYNLNNTGSRYFDIDGKIGAHGMFFLSQSLGYQVFINIKKSKPKIYTLTITKGHQKSNPNIIKKIIDMGRTEQYVYDLETENHHFQAGIGQMIVHNTDGSHIKGLIINFMHFFWPSLLKIEGFVQSMATPIVKAWKLSDTKKINQKIFYTLTDFEKWKEEIGPDIKKWKSKYYKGLGTSKPDEARQSFNDFEKKLITYIWDQNIENNVDLIQSETEDYISDSESKDLNNQDVKIEEETDDLDKTSECYNAITLAFAKNRANDRKKWLECYDKTINIDNKIQKISFNDFINKDLIHFSNYDIMRSIPSICDGFKPSQRKILFGAFLEKIFKDEIKVAQLSGSISKNAAYHHGEDSLNSTIVSMAQNFVGSNNINLLTPNGNFGDRTAGGKNASSPRYIFTQLNILTPLIFRKDDEHVYDYFDDDGQKVEPITYAPIIPMILVNGATGIGTGFSTDIPCYNPKQLIKTLKQKLNGKECDDLTPWSRGFTGKIFKFDNNTYKSTGIYEIINENTIIITELPVGTWTENYYNYLDSLIPDDLKNPGKGQIIRSYLKHSGIEKVNIVITFLDGELQELIQKDSIEKDLKLYSYIKISNMHIFDQFGKIKKYNNVTEILNEYYEYRLKIYIKRKNHILLLLKNELNIIKWKIKFLETYIADKITFKDREKNKPLTEDMVINQLIKLQFPRLSHNISALEQEKNYDYLTSLTIFSLTEEKLEKLKKEYEKKLDEYKTYKYTSVEQRWLQELEEFETCYDKWILEFNTTNPKIDKKKKTTRKKINLVD